MKGENMAFKITFAKIVTLACLSAAIAFKHVGFAATGVVALMVELIGETVKEKLFAMKNITLVTPEAEKRKLSDLEARVATLEYGVKTRGF
jgi:hypothetical protein